MMTIDHRPPAPTHFLKIKTDLHDDDETQRLEHPLHGMRGEDAILGGELLVLLEKRLPEDRAGDANVLSGPL